MVVGGGGVPPRNYSLHVCWQRICHACLFAGKIAAMSIPHPMCPLDSCKTRHPLGAPHASSGGKKSAIPKRLGKTAAAGFTTFKPVFEGDWWVTIGGCRCGLCDHEWVPRNLTEKPSRCPSCMSRNWNE